MRRLSRLVVSIIFNVPFFNYHWFSLKLWHLCDCHFHYSWTLVILLVLLWETGCAVSLLASPWFPRESRKDPHGRRGGALMMDNRASPSESGVGKGCALRKSKVTYVLDNQVFLTARWCPWLAQYCRGQGTEDKAPKCECGHQELRRPGLPWQPDPTTWCFRG